MDAERRAIEAVDRAAGKDPNRNIGNEELRVLVIDEVDDFVTAIRTGTTPLANAEDGLAALRLVEDVYDCAARTRPSNEGSAA